MKRRWLPVLLLSLFVLSPALVGCKVDHDDDDDMKVKVDTEGSHKGVSVDKD